MTLPDPVDFNAPPQLRLGQYLRQLRLDAELSQAELGRRSGIHRPIIGRIERGVHLVYPETVARIAGALELDVATACVVLDEGWCAAGRLNPRPPRVSARRAA